MNEHQWHKKKEVGERVQECNFTMPQTEEAEKKKIKRVHFGSL
jgi:hypothetical protein